MKLESLTIVFVDIKDYTSKTSDQSRKANECLLGHFAGLVKPMVRTFNGTIVKGIGDAYLITFKSPTDSLLCAMAVQDQLAYRNTQLPIDERFELRFAMHAGEVRVDKKDIFGEAVNIAARIEGITKAGEIYFSESVYLMFNKSEVPFEKVGLFPLKGIQEPVNVYRVPKLSEVGSYKLVPAENVMREESAPASQALPFGGLALKKVHTHMTGMAVEEDGSFYFSGALSEMHYAADARANQFGVGASWRKLVVPFYYVGALGLGGLGLIFRFSTYRGLVARTLKTLKLIKNSASYRRAALTLFVVCGLTAAASYLAWHQHQEDLAYKVMVEQNQRAAAKAKTREASVQKELQKEKKKFHFPW